MNCGDADFLYPMQMEIFYPFVEQGAYGDVKKTWFLDRTISCYLAPAGSAGKEEVKPNVNITQEKVLVGRIKNDIRFSSQDGQNAITNIVISNIKDRNCNLIYLETSGPRKGKSTIFEIASQEPIVGPFGNVEYYNIVVRRSENQAVDL